MIKKLREKILGNVKTGGPGGECWEWHGGRKPTGYGRLWHEGKHCYVHRLSFELFVGPIGDLHVLHRCDNPPCCNPEHLFLGTHADNMTDRDAKGRASGGRLCGDANGQSKLTEADVIEVHRRLARGDRQVDIASRFGVSKSLVHLIKNGRLWGHIVGTIESEKDE